MKEKQQVKYSIYNPYQHTFMFSGPLWGFLRALSTEGPEKVHRCTGGEKVRGCLLGAQDKRLLSLFS